MLVFLLYTNTMLEVLEKYDIHSYDDFKQEYPILDEMLLHLLSLYGISTDVHFYKYLNAEYNLNDVMLKVFGIIGHELSVELLMNWLLSSILTKDYEHVLQFKRKTKDNYQVLDNVFKETFFVSEIEFLSLVVNIVWKEDLNEFGYITDDNFQLYNNCILRLE
jgi:hypothetical protein